MPNDEEMRQTEERISAFALLLKEHLKERFGYKRLRVSKGLGRTVTAKTAKYDLYFRVTPVYVDGRWDSNTLVVARIGFQDERKGHGRALLQFLVDVADKLPYTHIGIEEANPEATAFGVRFGFSQIEKRRDLLAPVEVVLLNLH